MTVSFAGAHGRALREDARDVGVEAHQHILLILDLYVTLSNFSIYPLFERIAYDGINQVTEIGSRQLPDLPLDGQVVEDLGMLLYELEHQLDLETLILRYVDHPDVLALDVLLLSASYVSQMLIK